MIWREGKWKYGNKPKRYQIEEVLRKFMDIIVTEIEGDRPILIKGFGTFSKIKREVRLGVHPRTGERINVGGYSTVKFKQALKLKRRINRR